MRGVNISHDRIHVGLTRTWYLVAFSRPLKHLHTPCCTVDRVSRAACKHEFRGRKKVGLTAEVCGFWAILHTVRHPSGFPTDMLACMRHEYLLGCQHIHLLLSLWPLLPVCASASPPMQPGVGLCWPRAPAECKGRVVEVWVAGSSRACPIGVRSAPFGTPSIATSTMVDKSGVVNHLQTV